jgi:type IV pilus assembly protein PilB
VAGKKRTHNAKEKAGDLLSDGVSTREEEDLAALEAAADPGLDEASPDEAIEALFGGGASGNGKNGKNGKAALADVDVQIVAPDVGVDGVEPDARIEGAELDLGDGVELGMGVHGVQAGVRLAEPAADVDPGPAADPAAELDADPEQAAADASDALDAAFASLTSGDGADTRLADEPADVSDAVEIMTAPGTAEAAEALAAAPDYTTYEDDDDVPLPEGGGGHREELTLDMFTAHKPSKLRLGEIIVEMGLATQEQVDAAMALQGETRKRVGQLLLEQGTITLLDLTKALATKFGVPFIDLSQMYVDPSAAHLIEDKLARRYSALPVRFVEDKLLVAMADPQNLFALDDLEIITGYSIVAGIASEEDIFKAISQAYRERDVGENAEERALEAEMDEPVSDIRDATEEAPVVKLVNNVIAQSVDDGASDIHFEPQAKELVVRFRIDGVLHEVMAVPRRLQSGVLSRLKIMADLDIAERRVPQDGRIGLVVGGKPIDMRVATLPTVYGEKVVMRLLDKSNVMLRLEDLGFAPKALKRFQRSFTKPYGAILVTGPTGSGKSTTLYAALNILNSIEKNIITVEDPVEYRLTGINQVQVNQRAGMTFAAALRSILRCDPDIVMIGEIRDRETAQIAVESALTGHLVLSTLHTNDAPGALSRLTEMGIEPFLTASAVDCVLAQRLARRLCKQCKEPYTATREMLRKNNFPPEVLDRDDVTLYRPKGCARCNGTGYKGRLGLYEVMVVSEAVRRLTVERKSADEISRVAEAEGMKSLREDGIDKVLQGMTSVEEIARVIV